VWNGSSHHAPYRRGFELAPQKVMAAGLAVDQRAEQWFDVANLEGDAYLAEITEHIIPQIESLAGSNLPIAMMGSSMGALATIYALGERPDVFACGLAFSVHWPFAGDPLVDALIDRLPAPSRARLWMQNGTGGLDAQYAQYQTRADARLVARGFVRDRDFVSRVLRRSGHNEWSWARRLPDAIEWWLRGV